MHYWQNFWVLGKTERQGILFLLVCILLSLWLPGWLSPAGSLSGQPDKAALAALDSLQQQYEAEKSREDIYSSFEKPEIRLHPFDPNKVSKATLLSFGLREKTADGWINFRNKGGKFREAADIRKLYTLKAADADRLIAYVKIEQPDEQQAGFKPERPKLPLVRVDLNSADSLTLLTIPGIGPAFAGRILKARNRWGGWFETTQLLQIYGVDSQKTADWAPFILLDATRVKRLVVNSCDLNTLGRHPLIGFPLARRMIAFREQHGPFKDAESLLRVYGIDAALVKQLSPYVDWSTAQQAP